MTAPVPIPFTKAKLPRSITIKGAQGLDLDFTTMPTSAIFRELTNLKKIGAVEKISINQTVDLKEWREFDADQGGQIVEWVPGKEEITLTLTGVVLYDQDLIEAFGYSDIDTLLAMRAPFVVEINERRPKAGGGIETRSTYFLGCRFAQRPLDLDISTGDLIKMNYEVKAARCLRSKWGTE